MGLKTTVKPVVLFLTVECFQRVIIKEAQVRGRSRRTELRREWTGGQPPRHGGVEAFRRL